MKMAPPVRFQLATKKRKHGERPLAAPPVAFSADLSGSDGGAGLQRSPKRVALLEDVSAKVRRLKDEGATLAEAGRFRAAMARWQDAVAVDPSDAALFEMLAQAAMAVCEDFRAVQFAAEATRLAPDWSAASHTLARAHLNFGELSLARANIDKAIELNGGATEEMEADRRDVDELLRTQQRVLRQRDEQAEREADADRLQVISCQKHLSLRAQTTLEPSTRPPTET